MWGCHTNPGHKIRRLKHCSNQRKVLFFFAVASSFHGVLRSQGVASPFLSCSMAAWGSKKETEWKPALCRNCRQWLPCVMRGAQAAWKLLVMGDHHICGALTLFGGQRVLFFCLRLLQLCLVKTSDFSHVGLVRHFACDRWKLRKKKKHLSSGAHAQIWPSLFAMKWLTFCTFSFFRSILQSFFCASVQHWKHPNRHEGSGYSMSTHARLWALPTSSRPPPFLDIALNVNVANMLLFLFFYPSVCSFLCLFNSLSVAWAFVLSLCILSHIHTHTLSLSLFLCSHPSSLMDPASTAVIFLTEPQSDCSVTARSKQKVLLWKAVVRCKPPSNDSHYCVFETGIVSTGFES